MLIYSLLSRYLKFRDMIQVSHALVWFIWSLLMTVFNGRYCWDGCKKDDREPIAWYPGCYNLKIFGSNPKRGVVEYLKSHTCVYSRTGEGVSISDNPVRFAKQICDDFSLQLERVLWVEELHGEKKRFVIVMFKKCGKLGDEKIYNVTKREPRPDENKLIKMQLEQAAKEY